jgi:hypothetical protein
VENGWVLAQKRYETFRPSLDALGYSQVAGVYSMVTFLQVFAITSFRIIFLRISKLKLAAWSIDVETAFQNGDLTKEIYLRVI